MCGWDHLEFFGEGETECSVLPERVLFVCPIHEWMRSNELGFRSS